MKEEIIRLIEKEKLIVIVRGVEEDALIPLAEAMYEGGVRLLELTYDASGKKTDQEIARNIAMLSAHFKDRMWIGAGTVLKEEQVHLTKAVGGHFVISPDVNPAVIQTTNGMGMVSIPGALTPTEAQMAHRSGADFVKLFPMDALGPSYLKAIRAPLSHIRFLAVGGIDETNIAAYVKAGACGFGIGSNIVRKELLANKDYVALRLLAEQYVKAVEIAGV